MDDWDKRTNSISGSLLGTAIGDALGLPYEGLTPQRAKRMLGPPDRYRFCFGAGMVSDDTDHAFMTAVALLQARRKPDSSDDESPNRFILEWFEASLARQLKWWLASIPAGIGLATLRAILKLWLGWKPTASGVFSAGNGPAMRAPIIGTILDDLEDVKSFVRCSTRMTHTDPKAEYGALVVALAAHLAARGSEINGRRFLDTAAAVLPLDADELLLLLTKAVESVEASESTREFATTLGLDKGVTGYMYHTVPACIHAWLSFADDFEKAVRCIIECGGDADTTAAIVGGIAGATVGANDIRSVWRTKLYEPHSVVEIVGMSVKNPQLLQVPSFAYDFYCLRLLRNVFVFLPVVLFHGFRRLLPPY